MGSPKVFFTARYAVLPGYGLFDESNKDYKAYLDRFAAFCRRKKIDVAVLCGGHTNVKLPEKSEAGTMADYLRPLVPGSTRLELEEHSTNSIENIRNARNYVDLAEGNAVFFISDSVRFVKHYFTILSLWFGLSKKEVLLQLADIVEKTYENPRKKSINIEARDMNRLLAYKNVKVVIDKLHRNYAHDGLHVIVTEAIEIDALYDPEIENAIRRYNRTKEEARAKFGLK